MTVRRIVLAGTAGLALLAVVVLAGTKVGERSADSTPSAVDVGFAQDMIVHHQQAVLMAAYTREHAGSSDVRSLAGVIDSAQQREIGQMTGWLQSWGKPVGADRVPMAWMTSDTPGHTDHGMDAGSMPGMASPAELDRLVNLSGRQLDAEFLRLMARHHEGGLPMAKDAATRAHLGYVRNAARTMVMDQQREIDQMRELQRAQGTVAER